MIGQTVFDRVLHRFALGSRRFRRFCFARECERNGFAFDRERENVFVAGMARSGSTALLYALNASGGFAATTYAMMPFVLAPSLARITARLPKAPVARGERAHGDTVEIGLESAEALDAVFWSSVFPADEKCIQPRQVPPETLREYAMFIENLLIETGARRYLSKMNQGIDKIESLAAYFERSIFLVPFRDPLQQASSLLRQHENFGILSGYEKKYLEWLEHHEFGATHRSFCSGSGRNDPAYARSDPNYWLWQWREAYACLAELAGLFPNLLPVCYENMAQSKSFWEKLSRRLGIEVSGEGFVNRNRDAAIHRAGIDSSLQRACQSLYERLSERGMSGL